MERNVSYIVTKTLSNGFNPYDRTRAAYSLKNPKKGLAQMDCKQAVSLMHDLLDEDLERQCALDLKAHMLACPACRERFRQLEEAERLLYGFNHRLQPPSEDLTERIMVAIPRPQRKQSPMIAWVKRHPAITVAAVFFLVMTTSWLSMWNADKQLVVKGDQMNIIIQDDKVIVPSGQVVNGDLTIHNGKAEVHGEVKGNLTVVDGQVYQASTAHISGSVQKIDEAFDWIWYQINSLFGSSAVAP